MSQPIAAVCDLLIRADVVITQNDERDVLTDAGVAVKDGLVHGVGEYSDLEACYEPRQRLDLSGRMLMPGLVNGHTHLPMTLLRGVADDLPLMEWLEQHIWPVEKHLTLEMLEIGAQIGCAELIRTGCTSFLNGYFHEEVTGDAVAETGLRTVLGEGFFSFPSPMFKTAEDCWQTLRTLDERYQAHPRVRTAVTPHATFTVEPEELAASFEVARSLDTIWQTHLAESPIETAVVVEKYGQRPVELLDSLKLLTPHTTLHHCVDVNDEEIELLADKGVNVVHNPVSNLKLASGLCPVQKLLNAGVNVGLGTDGASSNNQLNMFRDMGLAALIGKVKEEDAQAVNAQTALDMATRNSAHCLGWPELGRIEVGAPADMVALDLGTPNMMPVFNPVSHVVYAATGMEVCMTMVAGEILFLYGEYRTFDLKSLQDAAYRAKKWVADKAKK